MPVELPYLQLFSWSEALAGISSTQSAGNQPTWPRALPSQNPPSPTLRTGRVQSYRGAQLLSSLSTSTHHTQPPNAEMSFKAPTARTSKPCFYQRAVIQPVSAQLRSQAHVHTCTHTPFCTWACSRMSVSETHHCCFSDYTHIFRLCPLVGASLPLCVCLAL